jgi:hypothetical protein
MKCTIAVLAVPLAYFLGAAWHTQNRVLWRSLRRHMRKYVRNRATTT